MNELPPSTDTSHPPPPAAASPRWADLLQLPLFKVTIVLLLLLAALAWSTHSRLGHLRAEMARSLQKSEATGNETVALARQVQEQTKELQVKVAALEGRQSEAQSQQLALEALYQDLSKNRDEWALAEIEQVLSTASQQLQLAGNVQGALIALQNADRSLSRNDKPQFISIRRAIARDTDKLKALPGIDVAGLALRIDNVITQLDTLPMLSDSEPVAPSELAQSAPRRPPAAARGSAPPAAASSAIGARLGALWTGWTGEMWDDVRQLIRVRRVDTPEALMLSPREAYFTRENLKLRLLNARLALLSRNEAAFRTDLETVQEALTKYFDTRARSTQAAQSMLRQLQGNNLAIDMPTLADSLDAVRTYKAKP
ncbi:uroporphyrinogen-III C-methyltransferase [Massilia sp. PWRC2]|uniref:uroporphyrinogen-III C-methyltransferase n=1 Tax=Massilia sp. PWRC2 TaxID=2804626 RepID=UPI003CF96279